MQVLNSSPIVTTDCQFTSTNLEQIVEYYETLITDGDTSSQNYWYLGLAYLLQSREIDAQATWFIPFEEAPKLESAILNSELSDVLNRAANQELNNHNLEDSWLISQYLREIDSTHIHNLLRSILLAIKLELFTPEDLVEWQGVEVISTYINPDVNRELLDLVLSLLLDFPSEFTHQFIYQCLLSFSDIRSDLIKLISNALLIICHRASTNTFMTQILEDCLELEPLNTMVLQILWQLNCGLAEYKKAIDLSFVIYSFCNDSYQKVIANANIIRTLLSAGDWQTVIPIIDRHYQLLEIFLSEEPTNLAMGINENLLISATFLPYTADCPDYYRSIQNQISKNYLRLNRSQFISNPVKPSTLPKQTGAIRVGYLASTLWSHSVGWLSRWLWQYHDRTKFQIFTYCINQKPDDPFYQRWFRNHSEVAYCFGNNPNEVTAQISADEIDILIDLDSLTLDITCQVMAYKPAPVQISWLGWDSSGIPSIDYFIADPYVLPDDAQDYYQEKIWRLPQTYLAVDGFEIGVPTLKREDLDIPVDAVVYFSSQSGYKRHPDCIRSQLEIIKAVPNSYFLIKGKSDAETIQNFFGTLAAEVGISLDRLRFLERDIDEYTHRANLAIADVVLDTFPYNGATTTLETLWMGIPMVTQVGEQFAARNSYTFMHNAGIEEGIAWSQAEYIEWGIKLGLDRDLRDKIAGKLRSGRTTAPVWNAKQFTLDMEQAYRQMWAIYQEQNSHKLIEDYSNN